MRQVRDLMVMCKFVLFLVILGFNGYAFYGLLMGVGDWMASIYVAMVSTFGVFLVMAVLAFVQGRIEDRSTKLFLKERFSEDAEILRKSRNGFVVKDGEEERVIQFFYESKGICFLVLPRTEIVDGVRVSSQNEVSTCQFRYDVLKEKMKEEPQKKDA